MKWSSIGLSLVQATTIVTFAVAGDTAGNAPGALESVKGTGCYTYGDNETPAHAKRAAMTLAQEQAVRSYRIFVQSASKVKNFQLENDLIETASAAMLENTQVEKEEKKSQEICVTITARISPVSMEELIRQRVNAKEISQEAQSALMPKNTSFGLRVWTDKPDNNYVEGESLVINLQSERDGYLKLDYFQSDGTVVHLVPNMLRGQELVKAGRTYTFGDRSSPEQFLIGPPFGTETVKAILSNRPFEISADSKNTVEDGRAYIQVLQAGTRGIKVQATEESISLTTTSKVVEEYKKTRPPEPSKNPP